MAQSERNTIFYYEREVWWCGIGINVGVESDGKNFHFERPVLIVKEFSKEMFWGLPLTSGLHEGKFYKQVIHEKGVSCVMLSQLRTLSSKRLSRKIGSISKEDFEDIKNRLRGFLD